MSSTGQKILEPTFEIPEIKIILEKDANKEAVDSYKDMMGRYFPLITFGDNVIHYRSIVDFELTVMNGYIPTFSMTVDDDDYSIRTNVDNGVTTGCCRIGYENYRMQFKVAYTSISESGDSVYMSGRIWTPNMYKSNQKSYKNQSITDIIKSVCTDCSLGLYVYPNNDIDNVHDLIIQPNQINYDFVTDLLLDHTQNLWCYDPYYYLHIGSLDTLMSQDVGTYTMNFADGKQYDEEHPLIFFHKMDPSSKYKGQTKEDVDSNDPERYDPSRYKIPVKRYEINSGVGYNAFNTKRYYQLFTDKEQIDIPQRSFGMGVESSNTYSGFKSTPIPFVDLIKSKTKSREETHIFIDRILPEINPLQNIELELYLDDFKYADNKISKTDLSGYDDVHSGKRLVIGYIIRYNQIDNILDLTNPNSGNQLFEQEIICI